MNSWNRGRLWITMLCVISLWRPPCSNGDDKQLEMLRAIGERNADIIEKMAPSVVSVIRIKSDTSSRGGFTRASGVGRFRAEMLQIDPNNPSFVPTDFGTGVVLTADGLILTTNHVVSESDYVIVRTQDGKGYTGQVWAADPRSDLAVVRITATDLAPIVFGNVASIRPGHFVIGLGNPYASARDGRASATMGIVSNIARRPSPAGTTPERTIHHSGTLIQTDLRLHYGTSGGALLNLEGELVGLTTSLAAIEGFDQAAGYAIPMDVGMRRVIDVLIEGREVEYGFLGVTTSDIRSTTERPIGVESGARVEQTYPGLPAAMSGLRSDDVITAIGANPVRNHEELILRIGLMMAGSTVELHIVRSGKKMSLPVTLAKFPVEGPVEAAIQPDHWQGITVEYMSVLLRNPGAAYEKLSQNSDGGVLVERIQSGSAAETAGLRVGTVINKVGSIQIRTPKEFFTAVRAAKAPVKIQTDQGEISLDQETD